MAFVNAKFVACLIFLAAKGVAYLPTGFTTPTSGNLLLTSFKDKREEPPRYVIGLKTKLFIPLEPKLADVFTNGARPNL